MAGDEEIVTSQQQNALRISTSEKEISSEAVIPNGSKSFLPEEMESTMTFIQKTGFGLGHVYNDLCAGVWFSYTLLFMQNVLQMSSFRAGTLVMLGQVGDALATPIVGILADKYYTKRMWHTAGNLPKDLICCANCKLFLLFLL